MREVRTIMNRKAKFWNWARDETTGDRVLRLEGVIDDEVWWGDEVTPEAFRSELYTEQGNVELWINSPGGNVFAADQIYNMIKEYPGRVTVKIDALAASAASYIAMAGDKVLISPVAQIMIHNPSGFAAGEAKDMEAAARMLKEIKEGIINAYELKTGLDREELSRMMDEETFISAKRAVELGFADDILYTEEPGVKTENLYRRLELAKALF